MDNLIQKSVLGASLVFTINYLLFYLALFLNFDFINGVSLIEGHFFGVLFNYRTYVLFIIINGISFILVKKLLPNWKLWVHVVILFLIANNLLGRFEIVDSSVSFYWLRYGVGLASLIFINIIVNKVPWGIKLLIPLLAIIPLFISYYISG